ncbi:MAG: polymer-forming cytoskeletal protein [Hyphomonas sp.]
MFTKNNKTPAAPPPEPQQKPVPAQDAIRGAATKPAARAASIICADMKINGSVVSEGALQIDGIVDGDVSATDITIGASGQITGEVKAEVVKVKGRIKGSIRARKVELETGAHVKGDIVHSSLQIQSNAVFEGQVKHADDPLKETGPVAAAPASESKASSLSSATPGPYSISSSSPLS